MPGKGTAATMGKLAASNMTPREVQEWIARQRSAPPVLPVQPAQPAQDAVRGERHGSVYTYQKRGCRCDACRAAVTAYYRERRGGVSWGEHLERLAAARAQRANVPKPKRPRVAKPRPAMRDLECQACGRPFRWDGTGIAPGCCGRANCARLAADRDQPEAQAVTRPGGHAHRWRIDEPNGPMSRGVCECGAERAFSNVHPEDIDGRQPLVRGRRAK